MAPKTTSILSYLGLLWLVAFYMDRGERTDLSRYHLRQGLGLITTGLVLYLLVFILMVFLPLHFYVYYAITILLVLLMVFGIIHAINEIKLPVPLIGKLFEHRFKFIDN